MLKTLSRWSQAAIDRASGLLAGGPPAHTPVILKRTEHNLSRRDISRNALKVLNRLHESGHAAYLVGGGVRDALVGIKPKDFDVATDASPETVRKLFRNSRIIGRRFRLVHVVFGREIIEVATFRAAHHRGVGGQVASGGRIVRDNVFGTIEEDAWRRDFSVNALYYNIADYSVIDFVGGLADVEARVFRLIGNPATRCEEDPVRVLRAVRLAAKLEFAIHADTLDAMRVHAPALADTPPARLFEEVLKLFQGGYARRSFDAIVEHDLLKYLFPLLASRLAATSNAELRRMLDHALDNTDRRVAEGKPITPAYLLAFMLWADVQERALVQIRSGSPAADALQEAADDVMGIQLGVVSIPRRFSGPMREIWTMQPRLEDIGGAKALSLLEERRFRAAYDFLCLRAMVDPRLNAVARWWTKIQDVPEAKQQSMQEEKPPGSGIWGKSKAASRRRRGRRRSGGGKARAARRSARE